MRRYTTILLAICAICAGAQTTQKLSATKANDYALIYALPNTELDITFETEKTVKLPGEFYKYARKYLNIDDAILAPSESVTLKSVTVTTRGVANPEQRYAVKFNSSNPPFMIVGDQTLPLAINTQRVFTPEVPQLPKAMPAEPTILQSPAAKQAVSQEMLQSTSTAKRAELAAELIYGIRESRKEIISGQSDQSFPDGKALQLALDNLAAQEAALTAMFAGTTQTSTEVSTLQYTPDDDVTNEVIARLSVNDGIVPPTDLAGEPIYLTLTAIDDIEAPTDEKGNPLPFPKGGFAYIIPGKAKVTISYAGRQMLDKTVDLAQFGLVYGLSPNLFTDKKAPIYAIFDPATGAIRELGQVNGD